MFMQATTYAIAVLGMVVVLGYTGQINLAQAAFFGFGAYGVALGTVTYGLPFWVSLAIGIGIAAHRRRHPRTDHAAAGRPLPGDDHHQLPADLRPGGGELDRIHARSGRHRRHRRPSLFGYDLSDDRAYLLLCALVLYAMIALVWWLPQTRLGRAMRGVRENELAAEVVGVHTLRVEGHRVHAVRGAGRHRRRPLRRRLRLHQPGQFQFHRARSSSCPWCCSAARSHRSAARSAPRC